MQESAISAKSRPFYDARVMQMAILPACSISPL